MAVEWREHFGRPYLYVDYAGCITDEQMLSTYEEQAKQMRLQPRRSLVLSNFTRAAAGSAFMDRIREGGVQHGDMLAKNAVVGITGLKGILLDGFVNTTGLEGKIRAFDTEAEALDWLTAP